MSIKMASLMKATGETRSTLLFYVKEGLLQEPSKPKPNVHLYADDSVERVRLIKTLQNQFHYTITQIKQVFDDNSFDFENGMDGLIQKLDLFTGVKERQFKSLEEALDVYDLDQKTIEGYVEEGILELHKGYFNDSSWKALQVLNDLRLCTKSSALLKAYVKSARELAVLEYELGAELVENKAKQSQKDNISDTNHAQEVFLDLLISLKPYIFNLQTKREHTRRTDV